MPQVWGLEWEYGAKTVTWQTAAGRVAKAYTEPIQTVRMLKEADGVAIVEPAASGVGRRNAVIFNADGSERVRLKFPINEAIVYAFDSMYYIQGRLTAIVATTKGDFAVTVDPMSGEMTDLRPSR